MEEKETGGKSCRYHCNGKPYGGCGRHFASLRAFDWHRPGSECIDPEKDNEKREAEGKKARFVATTETGSCDIASMTTSDRSSGDCVIWAV